MAANAAIALLFFLHGARLSPEAALAGARYWRLHLVVLASTFVLFPALGLSAKALAPGLLTPPLWTGVILLCALPSTVQSSIAFTSIARGNVAAAICAATASNLLGMALTPLLVGLLLAARREDFRRVAPATSSFSFSSPSPPASSPGRGSARGRCATRRCSAWSIADRSCWSFTPRSARA